MLVTSPLAVVCSNKLVRKDIRQENAGKAHERKKEKRSREKRKPETEIVQVNLPLKVLIH